MADNELIEGITPLVVYDPLNPEWPWVVEIWVGEVKEGERRFKERKPAELHRAYASNRRATTANLADVLN